MTLSPAIGSDADAPWKQPLHPVVVGLERPPFVPLPLDRPPDSLWASWDLCQLYRDKDSKVAARPEIRRTVSVWNALCHSPPSPAHVHLLPSQCTKNLRCLLPPHPQNTPPPQFTSPSLVAQDNDLTKQMMLTKGQHSFPSSPEGLQSGTLESPLTLDPASSKVCRQTGCPAVLLCLGHAPSNHGAREQHV